MQHRSPFKSLIIRRSASLSAHDISNKEAATIKAVVDKLYSHPAKFSRGWDS